MSAQSKATIPIIINMTPTIACLVQKQAPEAKRNAAAIMFFSRFERSTIPAPFGPGSQSQGVLL